MRSHGHEVWTPTLTGLGERSHLLRADLTTETGIQDIVGVLESEELRDVVLVGHSAGGVAVSGVADRVREHISALIYLDAVIVQNGESLATYFTPMQVGAYDAALAQGAISFPPPPATLFDVPNGPDVEWINRRLTPQPFSTAASPLHLENPVGNGLPCAYIACIAPAHPFVAATHDWAKRQAGWKWREMLTGHEAMVTAPEEVADLLESLARECLECGQDGISQTSSVSALDQRVSHTPSSRTSV